MSLPRTITDAAARLNELKASGVDTIIDLTVLGLGRHVPSMEKVRHLTDLNIVAVDVNTVSPPQDVNGMAAHLCAHVIYETLVLLFRQMGLAGDC